MKTISNLIQKPLIISFAVSFMLSLILFGFLIDRIILGFSQYLLTQRIENIQKIIEHKNDGDFDFVIEDSVLILNDADEVLYGNDKFIGMENSETYKNISTHPEKSFFVTQFGDEKFYTFYVNHDDLKIAGFSSKKILDGILFKVLGLIVLIEIVLFGILLFVFEGVFKKVVVNGLQKITEKVNMIGNGDYMESVDVRTCKEFDSLSTDINKTMDTIMDLQLEAKLETKRKSQFLANMSHEIRTPMNAIVGMSELALDFNLSDSEKNTIRQIRSSGEALVGIINDILDFSKIESGKMEICPVDYDLVKLMNDIMNVVVIRLKGKDVRLILEIDPTLPAMFHGDDMRIRQILINLAGNSAKFTEKGFVAIRVERLEKFEERKGLRFSVIDTGVGIKPDDLKKLFNAFQQVDMGMNRNKGGTGLGLTISKNLVKCMGGSVGVKSEYGKGSCFYADIPMDSVGEKSCGDLYKPIFDVSKRDSKHTELKVVEMATLCQPEFAGLFVDKAERINFTASDAKILVVDDNEVNIQVAEGLLKKFGVIPDTALSGFAALDKISETSYDIIFMDHQMPVMDGVETLKKIREKEAQENGVHRTVIALSANAVNGAKEMFLKNGFDDFVSKPVQGKDFAASLKKWLKSELIHEADASLVIKSDIPSDFIKPDSEKIALEKAVENAGGFENWLKVAKTFVKNILENSEAIRKFWNDRKYKDYTILVHALKSSARIIGAENLSKQAEYLESCGNQLQAAESESLVLETDEKTSAMLELYSSYIQVLENTKNYGEKSEDEKSLLQDDDVIAILGNIRSFCDENDLDSIEQAFDVLKSAKLSEKYEGIMAELGDAVDNIDFDRILEIVANAL